MDLSLPLVGSDFFEELDSILHLAGLYEFDQPFSANYRNNVLSTLNLIQRVKQLKSSRLPQIFYASTYAVGFGSDQALKEETLQQMPSSKEVYSYTKASAEQALVDSGLPARIFRLGILVGDSQQGEIEKIDGPYYLMRFLHRLSTFTASRYLRSLPVPLAKAGVLPLVPVDSAANVFHRALFFDPLPSGKQEFYGTYRSNSIDAETLCYRMFENFLPACQPKMISSMHTLLLNTQARLTQIPKEVFGYSLKPVPLESSKFEETFGNDAIPHFDDYQNSFFEGFRECLRIGK
jgi:thioester reductase-like protein